MESLRRYGIWPAIVSTALMLLAAVSEKLIGFPALNQSFAIVGVEPKVGYFLGIVEVAGAIGLFIRPLSALAAVGIASIMLGAVDFHLTHSSLVQGIPAFLILALCCFIYTQRRSSLFFLN